MKGFARLATAGLEFMALFAVLMATADAQFGVPPDCDAIGPHGDCAIYGISMLQLLANPQKYDGYQLRVVGYIHFDSKDSAIYLHKEDQEHHLFKNGVLVSLAPHISSDGCQDSYAVIEGLYRANNVGHMRMWNGVLTHVARCQKVQ